MPPRSDSAPPPSAPIPLRTVIGRLSEAQSSGRIDGAAVQQALGLRSLYLAERLLVALARAVGKLCARHGLELRHERF